MNQVEDNFRKVEKLMAERAQLIAVSKNQSPEKIQAALDTGHRVFGENKVQEAMAHWSERRALYPGLELHLIGALQTNKTREAVALFDVIETLDREKLINALAKEEKKQNRRLDYFIQVNTGDEAQKAGASIADVADLLAYAREKGLRVTGLMCIPPVDENPRPHFRLLKKLGQDLGLLKLSMGMSADFETAIEEGANYIRIGTALFGQR